MSKENYGSYLGATGTRHKDRRGRETKSTNPVSRHEGGAGKSGRGVRNSSLSTWEALGRGDGKTITSLTLG